MLGDRIQITPQLPDKGLREQNRALIGLHRLEHPDQIDDLAPRVLVTTPLPTDRRTATKNWEAQIQTFIDSPRL